MAIDSYDALQPPDPLAWLALGEEERLGLIGSYHRSIGDIGENERIHCLLHAIVENQIAMGAQMQPVRDRLRQLMAQGLDRHAAIHAIATVLMRHMQRLSRVAVPRGDQADVYFRDLKRMSASKYLAMIRQ
jgi:uncharacterized protein YoaH (UPF0181 family)